MSTWLCIHSHHLPISLCIVSDRKEHIVTAHSGTAGQDSHLVTLRVIRLNEPVSSPAAECTCFLAAWAERKSTEEKIENPKQLGAEWLQNAKSREWKLLLLLSAHIFSLLYTDLGLEQGWLGHTFIQSPTHSLSSAFVFFSKLWKKFQCYSVTCRAV